MPYTLIAPDEQSFGWPRDQPDDYGRTVLRLRDYATPAHSQASVWRYPPGAKGRRHRHLLQEEVFFVVRGHFSVLVGEPPERKQLDQGSILFVPPMTALQLVNDGAEEGLLFIYGAPGDGAAEYLDA